MITIQVCVGSSCFLRGATGVITTIQEMIDRHGLRARVMLKGSFCLEKCTEGVTVVIDKQVFTGIRPKDIPELFAEQVLPAAREGEI